LEKWWQNTGESQKRYWENTQRDSEKTGGFWGKTVTDRWLKRGELPIGGKTFVRLAAQTNQPARPLTDFNRLFQSQP
jgi:hypothetical protein